MPKTRKNYGSLSLPMHDTTFDGLHHWHRHVFEEMGWMVLAKAKGYGYKVSTYKQSIGHLIKSIENGITTYTESDRKHDLTLLLANVKVLDAFVKKNF